MLCICKWQYICYYINDGQIDDQIELENILYYKLLFNESAKLQKKQRKSVYYSDKFE